MKEEEKQLTEFNEKWEMHKVISEAIAKSHPTPAPETIKMFERTDDKIEDINHKLDNQDLNYQLLRKDFVDYVKSDNEFKEWMTPILKAMEKQQNFFSVGGTIAKGLILIGAVGTTIVGGAHFIKEWINN